MRWKYLIKRIQMISNDNIANRLRSKTNKKIDTSKLVKKN
jgi:hypothetical protein